MSLLLSPFKLREVTLRNRIVVSPMCQYSAVDGFAGDWHLVHLGSRAVGGAGLVIAEATAVTPEGRISPDDLGLWDDAHIEKLRQITDFIRSQGAVAGIQLAHAGRKASTASEWKGGNVLLPDAGGWQTVAPSAVPYRESDPTPRELTIMEIQQLIADFGAAARRALAAGFQVVELHAAHGYLIHQFLSPLSNRRTDEYGGSFDNRIRFLLEIVAEVRRQWPDHLPLLVRISATDWVEGGWNGDDSVRLATILKDIGVDLIDASTGAIVPGVRIHVGPGYQLPFASRIRKETGMPTGAVGMITDAAQAETILMNGDADLIFMARELLRDPYFPLHAAAALGEDVEWPVQYRRAKPKK
jgi:2,4-dienoyl-CoA reductase-like NADH-dependent reductase (Old Yellow Enzyme family)